jgi:hypothetical protein
MLALDERPAGAMSWKIGPSGEVGPDGYRLPSDIWCAVGLYSDLEAARGAVMPFLDAAVESWHAVLLPVMHRGECNHLNRAEPGTLFEVGTEDPGGICVVLTTAGFVMGPDFQVERAIAFRRQVDVTNAWMGQAEGCLANQVFTPHTVGDDGFTMSVWRDDASMLAAAYRPGDHRTQLERQKTGEPFFDRSSFTRCRILDSCGTWEGRI